jgi:hypothetical protein
MNRVLLVLIAGGLLLSGQSAFAKSSFLKKAKDLGLPGVSNCQACHISTESGNIKLNDRGNWLLKKQRELKAGGIDVAWLKDYKPAS